MSTATPSLSDARLARRAGRGQSRAFEAIFRRYHQQLYRYCAAIVGNSADAQDAVQNTMVKVLQALPGEERQIALKPWLYRIAHNEAIEIIRRRPQAEAIDAESLLAPADAAEQVEARDRLRGLVADIAELPERQRGALVMRELSGLSFEQIGAALGTSAAVARQTVYEARLGLRTMGEGREMDCAEAMRAISDGDRRLLRGRRLRAHLRGCPVCRDFRHAIEGRRTELALLAPLPAVASAGILQGVLGGAAAGKSLLGATAIKSAAAVGVIAAVGVTAADRGGLIDLGPGHSVAPPAARSAPPAAGAASARDEADGRGASPGSLVPAAGTAAGAARSERAVSGRRAADPNRASAGARGGPHRGRPEQAPAAEASPAAAAASPAHTDSGRHLGQQKHPDHGHAAAAGKHASGHHPDKSRGKSASAPGKTKPAPASPAGPASAHVKPKKTVPQNVQPPSQSAAGKTKQAASEATPAAAPPAESDQVATPSAPEAAAAEPPPHGKFGAEESTP